MKVEVVVMVESVECKLEGGGSGGGYGGGCEGWIVAVEIDNGCRGR